VTLTKSRLSQAQAKTGRVSGILSVAITTQSVKRMELHDCINDLKASIALIESVLNDKG
jgi:hypothetical protein